METLIGENQAEVLETVLWEHREELTTLPFLELSTDQISNASYISYIGKLPKLSL